MAESTVNTPFGPVTVRHPDNATEEQILRFAKRRHDQRVQRRAEIEASFETATGVSDSAVENFLAGAGKFFVDRGRGISQLFGADNQDEIDRAAERDAPLLDTGAGVAGNVVGGVAATLPLAFIPGVNTVAGAGLAGAGVGLTEPVRTGGSRGLNTALGAGGGILGQRLGNLLTNRAAPRLTSAQQTALQGADELGFRTTAGVRTGSQALQRAEAALESRPFTSGPIDRIRDANQTRANQIVAESIGEIDDVVDSSTLNRAFTRIGGVFERVAKETPDRVLSADDSARLGQFVSGLADEFDGLTNRPVLKDPLIQQFQNLVSRGSATGRQLQTLTSKLGRKANTQMTSAAGDRELGNALLQTKEAVDDLIQRGLSEAEQEAFAQARSQWRNLMLLLSRQNNVNPSTGNVNLNAIASTLQRGDRFGFLRGNNNSPLNQAARFGQAFRPIVGDSGTATRSSLGPADTLLGLPANLASRSLFSSPVQSAITRTDAGLSRLAQILGPAADPAVLAAVGSTSLLPR
jgi:hypothetical protein